MSVLYRFYYFKKEIYTIQIFFSSFFKLKVVTSIYKIKMDAHLYTTQLQGTRLI